MKLKFGYVALLAFILAGCATQTTVKNQTAVSVAPVASPTPTTGASVPLVPSLVAVRVPVPEADYQSAISMIGSSGVTPGTVESYFTVAQYQYDQGQYDQALSDYQQLAQSHSTPDSEMDKAQYMVGQVYYDQKNYLSALAAFQNILEKYPQSSYAEQSRQMMGFILTYCLGLDDLQRYVANYPDSPVYGTALFQLGSRQAQNGMQNEAVQNLSAFLEKYPKDPSASSAQLLLQSLQSQQQGKTWKIGVLVPLTGARQSYGSSVLNGVKLAVQQANQGGGSRRPMSIEVRDTGGDPLQAVKVFQDLTQNNDLDAIIGPVLPNEVAAVAPLASQQKIPLICPAMGRDGLSTLGPYLFSNSMTNEMQGRAMAAYAVQHLGLKTFGILSPNDGYGSVLADSFQKTVEALGATVTASAVYPPNATDFKAQMLAIGGQDPEAAKDNDRENTRRLDEFHYNLNKEIEKIVLKAGQMPGLTPPDGAGNTSLVQAVALIPFTEALGNTLCPSIVSDVNQSLQADLQQQNTYAVRTGDLVQQSLSLLPPDMKGTTVDATAEQLTVLAQDLKASILVTGHVLGMVPSDPTTHPTWDYSVILEAYEQNPSSTDGSYTRIYQNRVPLSTYKPVSLLPSGATFQALYLPAHTAEVPLLVSQAHFYNLNPVFLGGHLWDNESVLQEGGKDLEGSYFVTNFYVDSNDGLVKQFASDYLAQFSARPDFLAAQSYDAARLLLQATAASLTREDIKNQLLQIQGFDGVSGQTTFGGHGEADKVLPILKVQNGQFQQVQ